MASTANGRSREIGAVAPTALAAIRNVTTWPMTTTADVTTTAGHALARSTPSRTSVATRRRTRAQRERASGARTRPTTIRPTTAATAATAANGTNECTGEGNTSSTAIVSPACTN
jgi:hypothetical protein